MNMQKLRDLLRTPKVRVGLLAISITIFMILSALFTALPAPDAPLNFPDFSPPATSMPIAQQRPDLEPLIRQAVRGAVNEALDTKLSQQTDRVLGGIYAAAGFLAAFMALIAAGVWKLHDTATRHAGTLGEIKGFLQVVFPNHPWPQPPADPPPAA